MPAAPDSSSLHKVQAALRQDPKKSVMLGGLILVLAIVTFRAFGGGASKVAGMLPRPLDLPAADSVTSETSPASNNGSGSRTQQWLGRPTPTVTRNLFRYRSDVYRPVILPVGSSHGGGAQRLWTKLEKSFARAADERRQRELRLEALRRDAATLRLQTTVMGTKPAAMIDGRLVREGETLGRGFRVVKIEPRRVWIERDGERIELNMHP